MAIKFNKLIQGGSEWDELEDIEDQATADLLVLCLQRLRSSDSKEVEYRALPDALAYFRHELGADKSVEYDWTTPSWDHRMEIILQSLASGEEMVFMSHKTGDTDAEVEARYIQRKLGVKVYMAEWDPNVHGDSNALPDYIMRAIDASQAFLVHVIDEIKVSMWIGYEIGGAHAKAKPRAKIMYSLVGQLPSVVDVLDTLDSQCRLVEWLGQYVGASHATGP